MTLLLSKRSYLETGIEMKPRRNFMFDLCHRFRPRLTTTIRLVKGNRAPMCYWLRQTLVAGMFRSNAIAF